MHWLVTGTRGGKPGRWKLEAADESAARQKAVAGGVAVQDVRAILARPDLAEPPPAASPLSGTGAWVVVGPQSGSLAAETQAQFEPPGVPETGVSDQGPAGNETPGPDEFSIRESSLEEVGAGPAMALKEAPMAKAPVSAAPVPRSTPKRGTSAWGVAAIAAGVLASAAAFISLARVASIPLAGLGLLLALIGVYFSIKRKRSGMLLPVIGAGVCAGAIALGIVARGPGGSEKRPPSLQELQDRARVEREAQANIQVQFISIQASDGGKSVLTFSYNHPAGAPVARLVGQVRFTNASGQEIDSLSVMESFPQGLGPAPIQRQGIWKLNSNTAQLLQSDPSNLKVEFDPFSIN